MEILHYKHLKMRDLEWEDDVLFDFQLIKPQMPAGSLYVGAQQAVRH